MVATVLFMRSYHYRRLEYYYKTDKRGAAGTHDLLLSFLQMTEILVSDVLLSLLIHQICIHLTSCRVCVCVREREREREREVDGNNGNKHKLMAND